MKAIRIAALFIALQGLAATANACDFIWINYGDDGIKERVAAKIGDVVNDRYCKLFNKDYEIVVMFDAYSTSTLSLGHATAAVRKRGTKAFPAKRMSAFRSDLGNYTQVHAKELAATATIDALTEVMDDIDAYARPQK